MKITAIAITCRLVRPSGHLGSLYGSERAPTGEWPGPHLPRASDSRCSRPVHHSAVRSTPAV